MNFDKTFCSNKNCKARNECDKVLENIKEEDKQNMPSYISMAEFNCEKWILFITNILLNGIY